MLDLPLLPACQQSGSLSARLTVPHFQFWQRMVLLEMLVVRRTGQQEPTFSKAVTELLQLCIFCLGLEQDRNVGIGVFPEGKKIPVRGAGVGGVALQ